MTTKWVCQSCGRERASDAGLLASVVPAVKLGNCITEMKQTTWRPAPAVNAGRAVGERRKEAGMRRAEQAEMIRGDADTLKLTGKGWVELADAELRRLAGTGEAFTSDVLVGAIGAPETHYNAIGARINAAARKGLIKRVGYTKSSRETGHARTISVWQGA